MRNSLEGKVALVTGASGGIGSAIAARLAAEGAEVIVHGRDPERTRAAADGIRAEGGGAHIALGPLDSDAGAEAFVAGLRDETEAVDILVNNAGGFEVCTWWQGDAERWGRIFDVNVGSAVRTVQALVPGMVERGWGRVIQISSVSATLAPPLFPDYAAAKAAMLNATVTLAKELAGTGVTVNTVSPGPVVTDTWEAFALQIAEHQGWEEEGIEEVKERLLETVLANPSGRLGRPEDIARAVAFLARPGSDYINGVNLKIDGGLGAALA